MVKREWDKFDAEAEREGAALKGRKGRRLDPKRGAPKNLDDGKNLEPDKPEGKVNG
jgi:hypothetical protein